MYNYLYTMLKLYESFQGTLVLSLRTGGPVAKVISPIINPNNLYTEGWHVEDSRSSERLILLSKEIRDVLPQGLAINDYEVLSHEDDLVRLKDILNLRFKLNGLKVTSQSGKNYGKVSDFAFETSNFYIQKIYVAQPLIRNFAGGTLSIDRSQIIEITTKRIIIEDPTIAAKSHAMAPSPASS